MYPYRRWGYSFWGYGSSKLLKGNVFPGAMSCLVTTKHGGGQTKTACTSRYKPLICNKTGRGDMIRTCDPLIPNQMRYQAALRPEGRHYTRYGRLSHDALPGDPLIDTYIVEA